MRKSDAKWALFSWLTWGVVSFLYLRFSIDNYTPHKTAIDFGFLHLLSGLNLFLLGKGVARIISNVQEPDHQVQRPQLDRNLSVLVLFTLKGAAFLMLLVAVYRMKQNALLPTALGIGSFVAVPFVLGVLAVIREQKSK